VSWLNLKLVAVDVDGTLTESSRSLRLSPHSIEAVRVLRSKGYIVVLITGNVLPIAVGLSIYLGTEGPVVAENGCIVFYPDSLREVHLCRDKPSLEVVEIVKNMGFKPAWQNRYREHDLAFHMPRNAGYSLVEKVKRLVEPMGFNVYWSGFALHIQPHGGGKDRGVEAVLSHLNLTWDRVAAIGDGENDIPMLLKARLSATTSDSPDIVKRAVKYVASKPGGEGFHEFAKLLASI
jgi:phosphoglycolate phosphatase (TIGR01487 family)